jgi:HSP20 family protein
MARSTRFTRIISMADQLAAQLQGLHFSGIQSRQAVWEPAVNVYAHGDSLEVCVDLAGVSKQDIKVEVLPHRLVVRGHRRPPDSGMSQGPCRRILAMEIPDGSFERVLDFPLPVDADRVTAKQDNGWLWITLPVLHGEVVR